MRVELLVIIQLDQIVMANSKIKPACIIKVDFVLRDAISVSIDEVAIRSLDFAQGPNMKLMYLIIRLIESMYTLTVC